LDVRKRRLSIAVAALGAGVLAWFAPPGRDDVAFPVVNSPKSQEAAAPAASRFGALPERDALGKASGDPFGTRASVRPQVAAAKAAAPAAPVAPPNPYLVAGTVMQGGAKRVYLVNGDRVIEARQGDDLEGGYKVETIASDHVTLLYVAMNKKEELPIASTLGADVPVASNEKSSSSSSDASKPAELRWEGPDKVRAGSAFTLVLKVSSSQGLRATPMQLTYEPKLLEPVSVRAGKFFGEGKFSYRVNPDGSIFVGATGEGATPGDNAELVAVTFKPIKAGTTAEVKLASVALQSAAGRALPLTQLASFRTAIE
jgi:hypothetical protein